MGARKSLPVKNCEKCRTSFRLALNLLDGLTTLTTLNIENLKLSTNSLYAKCITASFPT